MITLEEAIAIRSQSASSGGLPHGRVYDLGDGWWIGFAEPIIGSGGVIVDKSDGHAHWLGSAMGMVAWMFAHRCGFRHLKYRWTITSIQNEDAARRLLSLMGYKTSTIDFTSLPLHCQFGWMQYDHVSEIARAHYIEFHFTITGCKHPGCAHIGSQIADFRHLRLGDGYEADFSPASMSAW